MLAEHWWFWALVALILGSAARASGRWRALAARVRRGALERRIVEPGDSVGVDVRPGGFWSELSWIRLLLGAWVAASPWIWGYADSRGAVAADVASGAVIVAATLVGIVFPAFLVLALGAGTWLLVAPWLVGYGDDAGAAGLSDTLAGLAVVATSIADMTSATRRVKRDERRPVARVRPRDR
jgi:SPW repeat-containing protein